MSISFRNFYFYGHLVGGTLKVSLRNWRASMTNDNQQLEFNIGDILGQTFALFKKLFPSLMMVYLGWLLLMSLVSMLTGVELEQQPGEPGQELGLPTFFLLAMIFVMTSILSGIITASVWSHMNNHESPIKQGLSRCMEVLPSLIGATLLVVVFLLIGLVLFIIPGFVVALALSLVTPVVIIENPGITASLKRSYELTDGYKLRILTLILIMFAAVLIPTLFIAGLSPSLSEFISPLINGTVTIFNVTMYVVIYKHLSQE